MFRPVGTPSKKSWETILIGLILAGGFLLVPFSVPAADSAPGIEIVSFHSHRYQDHARNRIYCEIFGEIKNVSDRSLTGVTVTLDFLDKKGKVVATEETFLTLQVIAPRKPKGVKRPVKPLEFGNFNQDTAQCPDQWLEGKLRYKVKKIDWK